MGIQSNEEKIEVLKDSLAGKRIQWKEIGIRTSRWTYTENPAWNFGLSEYRVDPIRSIYLNYLSGGEGDDYVCFDSNKSAIANAEHQPTNYYCRVGVKFTEVIE